MLSFVFLCESILPAEIIKFYGQTLLLQLLPAYLYMCLYAFIPYTKHQNTVHKHTNSLIPMYNIYSYLFKHIIMHPYTSIYTNL